MALLRYDIEVKGAPEATRALDGVDDAAREAAAGMRAADGAADELGRGLGESARQAQAADRAYEEAARSSESLNDRVKGGLSGFDELQGRLGQVTNALNLLSGVAVVGMISGIRDSVTALYEMTEAGKEAKASAEAMGSSIGAVIGQLEGLGDAAKVSTQAIFQLIEAQTTQTLASGRLKELAGELIEIRDEYQGLLRDLATYDADAARNAYGYSEQAFQARAAANKLLERYKEAETEFEREKRRLTDAAKLVKNLTSEIDKQGAAVATTTRSLSDYVAQLDNLTAGIIDLNALPEFDLGAALGEDVDVDELVDGLSRADLTLQALAETGLGVFREMADSVLHVVETVGLIPQEVEVSFEQITDIADQAIGAIGGVVGQLGSLNEARNQNAIDAARAAEAEAEADAERARRAAEAAGEDVAASKTVAAAEKERLKAKEAVLAAEQAAAEEKKRFAAIEFAIESVRNIASGVAETAKAAGSYPDVLGMVTHGIAAASHFAAAALFGAQAATAVSAPATPSSSAVTDTVSTAEDAVEAGDRGRGRVEGSVNAYFMNAQPLATRADIQDAINDAINESGRRRDRTRIDISRVDTRRRR